MAACRSFRRFTRNAVVALIPSGTGPIAPNLDKLANGGELFDLSEAQFKEIPVTAESDETKAERKKLQGILDDHPTAPGKKTDAPKRLTKQQKKARNAN